MNNIFRRTKIVATLGPSTDCGDNLRKILEAGVNMVRMNFSHGSRADHADRVQQTRHYAHSLGVNVAILGDLQGPKIRISTFKEGRVQLTPGQVFILDAALPPGAGDTRSVGIDYKELVHDVSPHDHLLLDDGRIVLKVEKIEGTAIHTTVLVGGVLSNNKGLNKLGGGLSAAALTEKDKLDIQTVAELDMDYMAVSFPRTGEDVSYARKLLEAAGSTAKIIAKIERAEAVASDEAMSSIILASDAIMVARGDLGVEIGDAELVGIQKRLIKKARQLNRAVITATQMMESMIAAAMPTRAEVMDVANAVLDGTDAVMLSAETASGAHPELVVASMARICLGAEKMPAIKTSTHRLTERFQSIEEGMAMSAMFAANHLENVKAIVCLTVSGKTALYLSRISSPLPIFAISSNPKTLQLVALYRGVTPCLLVEQETAPYLSRAEQALRQLKERNYLESGDLVIVTESDRGALIGSTNACRALRVP